MHPTFGSKKKMFLFVQKLMIISPAHILHEMDALRHLSVLHNLTLNLLRGKVNSARLYVQVHFYTTKCTTQTEKIS